MDIRQSLFSFANIAIAVIAAYLLFRKDPGEALVSRGPVFMVCFLLFFSVGIGNLPLALPGLYERLLGHSVSVNYMPPTKINVTQVGGTWWLVRWREPIQSAYFYVFLAGMAWAALNIVRRRAWKLNLFCVSLGVLLTLASLVLSFACFPFCL
jgi:hypothetical protein